jgi:hypothetical protein
VGGGGGQNYPSCTTSGLAPSLSSSEFSRVLYDIYLVLKFKLRVHFLQIPFFSYGDSLIESVGEFCAAAKYVNDTNS